MQNYNKIQKFISFLLIFSILFSFTINIKFFSFIGTIMASDTKYYNLVSIFVQEDIYPDIKNEVNTYAKNIQNTLENTKTIIIPTPKDEAPFNIASVNEKLYFEGESGVFGTKGNSKLVGSVFVGDLALPVVSNNGSFEKTVFPYVDFDDKLYIYNHEEKIYKLSDDLIKDPKAEIWHGFISPNTGNEDEDIKEIKDYFSKNEDYYNGVGNFKNEEGITNGKQDEELISKYEPAVFYYDQFRESKAVKYVDYKAYEGFLDNVEDITYNRFSKELADKLKENYFGSQQNFIGDISKVVGTGSDVQKALDSMGPTTNNIPDIQNRHIIENTTKKFLQIFNEATLGDFRKDVHNAGRYNSGSKVGVDLIPTVLSNIDGVSHAVIKNVNNDLENYIDGLVKKGLSRDIAVIDNFKIGKDTYTNFLYGTPGKNISSASGCTFYRGSTYNSGNLVEANRGFNVNLVGSDLGLCNKAETNGYWGGNSPVNLNPSLDGGSIWKLKSSNYKNAVKPLYDILGSLKTTDVTKNSNPKNCFDNNLLLTNSTDTDGSVTYNVPVNGGGAKGWNCNTTNPSYSYPYDFDYTYKSFPTLPVESCEDHYLTLDGTNLRSYSNTDCATSTDAITGLSVTQTPSSKIYNFHKIHSWVEHKSPNSDELLKQTQYMISPNLPIDKDRYIDFIGVDNAYVKINYPYLFRLILDENEEFNLENAKKVLKKYLDDKSKEINAIINKAIEDKNKQFKELEKKYTQKAELDISGFDTYFDKISKNKTETNNKKAELITRKSELNSYKQDLTEQINLVNTNKLAISNEISKSEKLKKDLTDEKNKYPYSSGGNWYTYCGYTGIVYTCSTEYLSGTAKTNIDYAISNLNTYILKAKDTNNVVIDSSNVLNSKLTQLNSTISNIDKQIDNLTALYEKIDKLEISVKERFQIVNTKITNLKSENKNLMNEAELTAYEKQIEELRKEINNIYIYVSSVNVNSEYSLKNSLSDDIINSSNQLISYISTFDNNYNSISNSITTLNSEGNTIKSNITNINNNLNTYTNGIRTINNSIEANITNTGNAFDKIITDFNKLIVKNNENKNNLNLLISLSDKIKAIDTKGLLNEIKADYGLNNRIDKETTSTHSNLKVDIETYKIFKTGSYPSANVDLYDLLKSKPDSEVEILGSKKTLSYIDTLIFSIYWNNLNSVGAKYKFIMENYLSDQFGGNNFNFFLPKNKKQYEMAYLGAAGDARNMYVKLDPEDKAENPYSDIISKNLSLNNFLLGNKGNTKNNSGNFKCAPPEGVPIWKWIPAVMCRLKDMIPPKISLTDQSCGLSLISSSDEKGGFSDNQDLNKNGINDFLEKELGNGSINLKSDSDKYYYNSIGKLEANLLNASGSNIIFDNISNVNFELLKVEIPSDSSKPFDETNKKVIFDKSSIEKSSLNNMDAYNEALKYVFFKDLKVVVKEGKAVYSFVTKSNDANITFKATVTLKDQKGNIVIQKQAEKTVQIRGDLFYATNYKLSKYNNELTIDSGLEGVTASANNNIFLIEEPNFNTLKSSLGNLDSLSNSKDKIFVTLINNNKKGSSLPINYPLTVKITGKDGKLMVEPFKVTSLNSPKAIGNFKESGVYNLEIKDNTGFVIKKEIEVLPDTAVEIKPNLSTTLIEKGGVITTNVFTIFDQFKNPTIGDSYNVEATISGDSLTFEDGTDKAIFNVIEGYKPFRLKSTSSSGPASITFKLKNAESVVDEKTLSLSVVDKINFEINGLPDSIKVGNNNYNYDLKILNNSESNKFNSRAYLISNNMYLTSNEEYIDVKDNFGTGSFTTKTKAGEKVKLEFKIEGVRDSLYKEIDILPDLPVKVDLGLSKSKIEADKSSSSNLYVELKDRYNNIVWTDNTTVLTLEILEKYRHIIKTNNKSFVSKKGKATFVLNGTNIPGTAFFKVSTTPDLSNNKIEIVGQSPFLKQELDAISGMRSASILTDTGKQFFEEYDLSNYRFKYYDRDILQSSDDFKALNPLQKTQILALYDEKNKLIIPGVGENAGKIETFYFWNKDKINSRKYNSIYTTLLGSNYGDITVKDNLANSILFDKNNRSLAVTALLNNLDKNIEVLNINSNGNVILNNSYSDLSQDISSNINLNEGNLEISFFNNTFDKLVSNIYYNFKDINLNNCNNSDLKNCLKDDKNIITLKPIDNNYKVNINEVSGMSLVQDNGTKILEISKDGKISKNTFTSLEISKNYTDGLVLDVKYNGKIVGNFAAKLSSNSKINFIRDTNILSSTKNLQDNGGIVVYLESRDYYYSQKYLGSSTKDNIGYTISYNDPFSSNESGLSSFSNNFGKGYESFAVDNAIGWGDDNKTLLSFAAGKSVGDSTKDYMSFSLINIGDPVISLKHIKKKLPGTTQDRKFDSTIGYLISKDSDNIAYSTFDYNNDGITDIVILKRDGYVELLEGTGDIKNFISRGNLIYLADFGTKPIIQTGDFTGDGYDDIVILNKNRQPVLLNNNRKDFTRINLNLQLNGIISQIISYDMDLDGKYDLVTLDDSGEININYGTSEAGIFKKSKVDSGLGININNGPRKDLGALYYDGLYQIPDDKTQDYIKESKELLSKENANSTSGTGSDQNEFNEGLVDKLIFTQMNYGGYVTTGDNKQDMLNNLPDLSSLKTGGLDVDNNSITDFVTKTSEDLNPGKNEYDSLNINKVSTFIKSEYAEYEGLTVEKKFRDDNGNPLKGGDKIRLDIKITNNTGKVVKNIAYVDKIPDPFKLSENTDYTLNIGGHEISSENIMLKPSPSDDFSLLIDSYKDGGNTKNISLNPGESIYLGLFLDTNAFEYGYIEAGIFDSITNHGDIIFKNKNENCGKPYKLYKSIATRALEKEDKVGVCKNEFPDGIKENTVDADKNGVPDYIDKLVSGDHSGTGMVDYAKDKLGEFNKDTDKDGLVDREELSPNMNNDDDFMNSLGSIDVSVDKIMQGIDTILDGLTCGFGGPGCISTPLNRAPLAPGNDPTIFGIPAGDGLNIGEGLPIFSALTWMPTYTPACVPVPTIFPVSTSAPWSACSSGVWGLNGAGGRLGTLNPTNFVRVFVTPTLTGAMGIAVCFGGPPIVAGRTNPKGLHPFVPGGNCVVASVPIGCKNDGSEGEIYNKGNGNIINGNCSGDDNTGKFPYLGDTAKEYLNYKKTGTKTTSLKSSLKDAFSQVAKRGGRWQMASSPLLNISGGGDSDFDMDVDFSALKSGNYEDVLKIKMTRISPFPDFIMEWVTRQVEEIANKLTDFPTLYVILPDFDPVFDSDWGNFIENIKKQFSDGEKKAGEEQSKLQGEVDAKASEGKNIDCEKDKIGCYLNKSETLKLEAKKNVGSNKTVGGIKAAYEFMSNLPMISIQTQKVNFNLPWPGNKKTIDKVLRDFEFTKYQRTEELERAKKAWDIDNYKSVGNNNSSNTDGNRTKIIANTQSLINSIDKNIEILNDYKRLPEKIHKMLKIKEIRINQILCNIETISKITGGRIGDNGKRFKAWVELYVLIKAILKSWQLLVDVFIDYSAECHQCKNERRDLMYFVWKMISAAMPKIPVIQFPKWPDIYLDLHNIRVQLNIGIPEYEFNLRPIIIPPLPRLYLPDSPNVNINLPSIPLFPRIELMELPDLPALPKIELPNLPPPPKLPKLLSSIEVFLDILKIITKVMCILKTSPFVPEWRAGDQIAFISERGGYLSLDFLDISLPQFSFPFVDAIKVTTYVNLEMDIEFLVEMSRQTALPLNIFTNDIVNMLNIGIGDLDFRDALPFDQVDVDIGSGGKGVPEKQKEIKIGNESSFNIKPNDSSKKVSIYKLANLIALNLLKLHSNIKKESRVTLSNEDFKKSISKQLPNIGNQKIVGVWKDTLNYSFTKEDALINDLVKNNEDKFNEVKSILNEQKEKTNKTIVDLEQKLERETSENIFINSSNNINNDYNTRLEKYNLKAINSIKNLFNPDEEVSEIRNDSKDVLNKVKTGLNSFSNKLQESKKAFENVKVNNKSKTINNEVALANTNVDNSKNNLPVKNNLLALNDTGNGTTPKSEYGSGNCGSENSNGYSYVYKGIYIVEEFLTKKISYLLFDYIDELGGKEKFSENDFDGDTDKDIIYMVGNEIFIKENLTLKKENKEYYSGNPLVFYSDDNKFYNNDFIEGVNGLRESISDNSYINLRFLDQTNPDISNYKIEFFDIVDKFDDLMNGFTYNYIPKNIKKYVIDAFRDIDDITLDMESTSTTFKIRKNLAYINSIGNLAGVTIKTKELKNLKDDINSNKEITINAGTKIYSSSDNIKLTYYLYKDKNKELKLKDVSINSYSNIEFNEDIVLVGLTSDAYVEGKLNIELSGNSIISYVKKPLIPGTKIEYSQMEVSNAATSYISIKYYDGSITDLDFSQDKYYELYDLGVKSDGYLIRTGIENNFYYVKAKAFKNNKFSTYSNQILLSPQKESDTKAPEITNFSGIKAPVYQNKLIDISDYVFEDSGVKNIKEMYIDFNLDIDSNNNGNTYDDKDYILGKTSTGINIKIEGNKIFLDVGPFDKLYDKKIRLNIIDANNNIGYKDIPFIIYSPIPTISTVENNKIDGKLNEVLLNEPTNFYRIRGGSVDKIIDKDSKDTTNTFDAGKFNFNLGVESSLKSGLELSFSGQKILKIDEETGKIGISDFDKIKYKLNYRVYSSNNKNNDLAYPKITILREDVPIYYEYLTTPNAGKVEIVDNFENLNKVGVYYKHLSNEYESFSIPLGVSNNAGDLIVTNQSDKTQTPIFKIFKDGRIFTGNEMYYLEYDTFDKYIVYNLKRVGSENVIGKVMIIPEKNFIMK